LLKEGEKGYIPNFKEEAVIGGCDSPGYAGSLMWPDHWFSFVLR